MTTSMAKNFLSRLATREDFAKLDKIVESMMSDTQGVTQAGPAYVSSTDFMVGPAQSSRRIQVASMARQLDCPRWWRSHLGHLGTQELLKSSQAKIKKRIPASVFENILSTGGQPASYERDVRPQLAKLRKGLDDCKGSVEENYKLAEPYLRTVIGKATPDEPIFHYERFTNDLLEDLALASRTCDAAEQGQDSLAAASIYEFLAGLFESLAAGTELVSVLTKKVKTEVRASEKNK